MMKKAPFISSLFFAATLSVSADAAVETLESRIPGAQKFEVLKEFIVQHVERTDDGITVKGSYHGKRVEAVQADGKDGKSFSVKAVGQPFAVSDFIPEMRDFPGDDAFRIERVEFDEKSLAMKTDVRLSNAELTLGMDPKSGVATVDSHGQVTIGSVLRDLKDTPVVNALIFENLTFKLKAKTISVMGKIRTTEATLTLDASKGVSAPVIDLAITKGLPVTDVLNELKDVPFVSDFVLEDLHAEPKAHKASAKGKIRKTEATLTFDTSKGISDPILDLAITKGLAITDVVNGLKDIPLAGDFVLEDLRAEPKARKVSGTGKVRKTEATLSLDTSRGITDPILELAIVKGLPITDVIADLAGVPVVSDFVFEELRAEPKAEEIAGTGKIRKTEATLTFDISQGVTKPIIDLKVAKGLPITDVIEDLKEIPIVADLVLEDLRYDHGARALSGTGKVRKTEATLTLDTSKGVTDPIFDLKVINGLPITDVVTDLREVPIVSDFVFEDLRAEPKAKTLSGTGKIRKAEATLTLDSSQGVTKPIIDLKVLKGLTLPDVLTDLKGVPVVGDVAFKAVRFETARKSVTVTGAINDKAVALDIATAQQRTIDLKADKEIGLADVITELKGLPGITDFGIKEFSLKGRTIAADMVFGKEPLTLAITLTPPKTPGGRFAAFNIKPDKPDLSIARLFPELSSVPVLKDFNLSGLNFVEKTNSLVSSINLGSGSGAKTAKITSTSESGKGKKGTSRVFKLTSPHLSIGDIVPSLGHIPMFNALKFDEVDLTATSIEATIEIGGASVELFSSLKDKFAALDFGGLSAATFIPGAGDTVLKDVKLASSVFVVSKAANVLPSSLPSDMLAKMGSVDVKTPFKAGINMLGNIRKEDLGPQLSSLFDKLSIKSPSFPVSGVFPDEIFDFLHQAKDTAKDAKKAAGDAKKEVVNAVLDALDLNIDVPVPEVDTLKKFATFKTAHLAITGNAGDDPFWKSLPPDMQKKKPTGRLDISVRGGITLNLNGFDANVKSPVDLDVLVDLSAGGGTESVSLLGAYAGVWDKPFGIKGLTFEKSGFDIALSTKKAEISFFSVAELHKKSDLSIDASFSESGGIPKLEYFVLDGPLALTDIAGDLPNASNFVIHEVKLYPTGIEAQVEAKNKLFDERTNLYLFELEAGSKKALVAAIDLAFNAKTKSKQNFSLGKLAKIAGLKGGKSKTIQTNLDAMAVANAALILSTEKVFPLPPGSLKDGIGKDLFEGIFGKSEVSVKLDNVTFLSDFQVDLMGDIGDKLVNGVKGVKLGLTEDAVINGSIGGLFDSDPLNLDLEFLMAESLSLDHLQQSGLKLPSFLKAKPKNVGGAEKVGIFLKVVDVTFEVGLLAGFDMQYNDTSFDFTGTLGIQLAEEEIGLSLSGSMSDTWKNALGIQGFELENVTVAGEIEADPPSIKIGLGGDANLWGHDMETAGDLMVGLAGTVPIPEGLGVKTTVSDLDVTMYEILNTVLIAAEADVVIDPPMWPVIIVGVVGEVGLSEGYTVIYDEVKGKKVTAKDLAEAPFKDFAQLVKDYSKLEAWIFGGKDVHLSFATPGASDANLGIPDGVHFGGKLALFGGALESPSIQPNIGWIYRIANDIYQAPGKAKHAAESAASQTKRAADKAGNKAKALTKEEFAAFKKNVSLLRDIVSNEVGLTKKTITAKYTKPGEKEVKKFLDSVRFTQSKPFKLGGLEFKDNHVSLVPFKVTSTTKLFGNEEQVELSLQGGKLVLETKTKIEVLGDVNLVLDFDLEKKDFVVAGEYAQNPRLQNWIGKEIRDGIKQIADTASSKYDALNKDLNQAKKLRDDAQKALTIAQAAVDAVSQAAVDRLRSTTNDYRGHYEHAQHEYDHCHGWKKYYCKSKWWPRKSLAWDTWKASEQLLADAEKALSEAKSLAVEVHKAEIKFNDAATKVALAAKDVASAMDIKEIVAKGLKSFADDVDKLATVFKLDKAFMAGSLKDVASGKPLVLELYFEIKGKKYREFFALSPTDAEFNAVAFGLMPVIASEHIIDGLEKTLENELGPKLGAVGDLAGKMTRWIKAHIYELIGGLHENLEKRIAGIEYELTQEESKYRKIFASLDSHAAQHLDAYKNLTDESNQILKTYKMTDFMPKSQVFQNHYLAVGHSSLCLAVASNGVDVYQQNCKDGDAERWSAVSMGTDQDQEGYVQLKSKGLCLKAANARSGSSGQPLILAQCNGKDDHEKWKFISQDSEFSKFVNRFSQKCLHFDTVNANEKAGYAVWTSCFGADSEGFREIKDAEKPSFYKIEREIRSRNGRCLAADADFKKYFTKTAKGHSTSDRTHLLDMQRQMDNVLHAEACDGDKEDRFNYVEAVNGDLKLVHAESGWCVVPGPRPDGALVLMPCDDGTDMYWKARKTGEAAFVLRNNKTGKCADLGATNKPTRVAVQAICTGKPEQVLEFAKE